MKKLLFIISICNLCILLPSDSSSSSSSSSTRASASLSSSSSSLSSLSRGKSVVLPAPNKSDYEFYQEYVDRFNKIKVSALTQGENWLEHITIDDKIRILLQGKKEPVTYEQWQENGKLLIDAVKNADVDKVKDLLELHEANVNAKEDVYENTALILSIINIQVARTRRDKAFIKKAKKIFNLLVNHPRIDVNLGNKFFQRPLFFDVDLETLDSLVRIKKADINARDFFLNTPLIIAVNNKRYDIAKSLIGFGADVQLADLFGKTALMYAAEQEDSEFIQYLVEKGNANPSATTHDGRKAIDFVKGVYVAILLNKYETQRNQENLKKRKTYS